MSLEAALERLDCLLVADARPLAVQAAALGGEPVDYQAALALDFQDFPVGGRWGGPWDTWWFRLRGEVPAAWAGREVVVRLRLSDGAVGFAGEGMLWRDGAPACGIAPRHDEYVWTGRARGGEAVEAYLEAAANPQAGGVVVPDRVCAQPLLYTLSVAELAVVDRQVRALARDLRLLASLGAGAALERAVPAVLAGDLAGARAALDAGFRRGAPGRHTVYAVGNAHIDTAWLWPSRETVRKTARTLATALANIERHPGYRFALSQPQQLDWVRTAYPPLFDRVRAALADGRIEPVGAMWVEPDCNVPGGESLVRQLVAGQRFWREHAGREVDTCWLPDAFGYPASLPQLLRQAGVRWFVSQKLSWNDTNRFPHHTFRWAGLDGSEVLAHFPPADTYNGRVLPAELALAEANERARGAAAVSLYLYGYGDGGGGPTAAMLERAERLADVDGLPRVVLAGPGEFLAAAREHAERAPVWSQELYFEFHRGTYTTHARFKRRNRQVEQALLAAEAWAAAGLGAGPDYPREELARAWRTLLTQHFHDVLPGTSIGWVYRDAFAALEQVAATAERVREAALGRLCGDGGELLAVNDAPVDRAEVMDTPAGPRWVEVGAYAAAPVRAAPPELAPVRLDATTLDNGILRARLDERGQLVSLVRCVDGTELLAGPANVLQLLDDRPANWDAWDIDAATMDTGQPVSDCAELAVVATGPLRAALRVTRRFGSSRAVQTVALRAGSDLLDLHTWVDWHEEHRLLKVAYPLAVRTRQARAEIQFGHVPRPTHRDTPFEQARFEVCAHRWIDLSEPGRGVALLNDGRYGFDVLGGVLRMSLLRSPTWPDPGADRGESEVRHALLAHAGDPFAAGVLAHAAALNAPLRLRPGAQPVGSVLRVEGAGLTVAALKAADDGPGYVVRVYEARGGHARGRLSTTLPVREAVPADLLERPLGGPQPLRDGTLALELAPFEVRTLLLR